MELQRSNKKRRTAGALLRYIIFLGAGIFFLLLSASILINQPRVQGRILRALSDATGYEITAGRIYLSLKGGLSLHAKEVLIFKKGEGRLSIPEVYLAIDRRALLRGRLDVTSSTLVSPSIEIEIPEGKASQDLLASPAVVLTLISGHYPKALKDLSLKNASFELRGNKLSLRHLDCTLKKKADNQFDLSASGTLISEGAKATYGRIEASLTSDPNNPEALSFDADLTITGLPEDLLRFPDVRLLREEGASLKLRIKGAAGSPLVIKGSMEAGRLVIAVKGEEELIDLPAVAAAFSASMDEEGISISPLQASAGKVKTEGGLYIKKGQGRTPHLRLNLSSPLTSLMPARDIVPSFLYPDVVRKKILPLLKSGSVGLEGLILEGEIDRIAHLERPENADVLSLRLFWRDVDVINNPLSPPLQGCSGKLSLQGGDLVISDGEGSWGKSRLHSASVRIERVFGKGLEYGFSGSLYASMEDAPALLSLSWIPVGARALSSVFSHERGTFELELKGSGGREGMRVDKADFLLKECRLTHPSFPVSCDIGSAAIHVGAEGRGWFSLSVIGAGSSLEASGSFKNYAERIEAKGSCLLDPERLIRALRPKGEPPLTAKERLPAQFTIKGDSRGYDLKATVGMRGVSGRIGTLAFKNQAPGARMDLQLFIYPDKGLEIKEASVASGRSALTLRSFISIKDITKGALRVSSQGMHLEDFGLTVEGGGALAGRLGFELEIPLSVFIKSQGAEGSKNPSGKLALFGIQGRLEASNLSLPDGIAPFPIREAGARIHLFHDKILMERLSIRIGETMFETEGILERKGPLKGSLLIKSPLLKPSEILPLFATGKGGLDGLKTFMAESLIEIEVDVARAIWKDFVFGPVFAFLSVTGTDILIERIEGPLPFGDAVITGILGLERKPPLMLSASLRAGEGHLPGLLELLGFERDYIEGQFSLSAELSAQGENASELLCRLNGAIDLELSKGYIRKSNVLLTILRFLSLEKLFRRPPPDLEVKGVYFEGIQGALVVENGVVETQDFIMQSPVINLSTTGTLDLSTLSVKAEMAAQPFGTIDAIASRIPLLGYILTGKDGTFIIYYFRLEGDIRNPSVAYIPFKNLGTGTLNVLHRLLLTPGRIGKKVSRMAEGVGKGASPSPEIEPEPFKTNP
jgi:hypothetical protein